MDTRANPRLLHSTQWTLQHNEGDDHSSLKLSPHNGILQDSHKENLLSTRPHAYPLLPRQLALCPSEENTPPNKFPYVPSDVMHDEVNDTVGTLAWARLYARLAGGGIVGILVKIGR